VHASFQSAPHLTNRPPSANPSPPGGHFGPTNLPGIRVLKTHRQIAPAKKCSSNHRASPSTTPNRNLAGRNKSQPNPTIQGSLRRPFPPRLDRPKPICVNSLAAKSVQPPASWNPDSKIDRRANGPRRRARPYRGPPGGPPPPGLWSQASRPSAFCPIGPRRPDARVEEPAPNVPRPNPPRRQSKVSSPRFSVRLFPLPRVPVDRPVCAGHGCGCIRLNVLHQHL